MPDYAWNDGRELVFSYRKGEYSDSESDVGSTKGAEGGDDASGDIDVDGDSACKAGDGAGLGDYSDNSFDS